MFIILILFGVSREDEEDGWIGGGGVFREVV
jgi:hypothetical protein